MKILILALCFCSIAFLLPAQNLPLEVDLLPQGRLTYGAKANEGFYDIGQVHKLDVILAEANWFNILDGSGNDDGESLVATLRLNDDLVLDSVLISIKGNTSDRRNNSEKKSFKFEIDEIIDQDLLGYDNLNLNCAFEDHSGMREVLYGDICKPFTPALKGSFIDLYINGEYWGPYNNVQQIEGTYIKEWFTNNDGTRWRALATTTTGGPGGNRFGAGTSTLNYNGTDTSDYNTDYTLKRTEKENPWEDLIEACDALNNLPIADLYDSLKYELDIDRALWFLVQENVFADDDGYIFKGGMDYYVYWDEATDRIIPMEVDGNSVLADNHIEWSPFYNEDDDDFPLLNRLLQNTELRQRYLAHMRTVLTEYFTEENVHGRIDEFAAILDQRVQDDPKKLYTYNQFVSGVADLKELVSTRIDILSSHEEVDRTGVQIIDVEMITDGGVAIAPSPQEQVVVTASVVGQEQKMVLYHGLGLDGVFERVEMLDDGQHGDGAANDDTYGAIIPGYAAGTYVRYYVEAIKDDAFSTASYFPSGAEHDMFVYQVANAVLVDSDVVINEFVADNGDSNVDSAGENEDWIELYNKGSEAVDLTSFYLSDDEGDLFQWQFPDNTILSPDSYLIVWLDDDEDQASDAELHANFKLSKDGEVVILANAEGDMIDRVVFGVQQEDISFARMPNGTGDFDYSNITFNTSNDGATTPTLESAFRQHVQVYPNPAQASITVKASARFGDHLSVNILNTLGQTLVSTYYDSSRPISVSSLSSGIYTVVLLNMYTGEVASERLIIVD